MNVHLVHDFFEFMVVHELALVHELIEFMTVYEQHMFMNKVRVHESHILLFKNIHEPLMNVYSFYVREHL